MSRIRKLEIQNFRGVKELSWLPSPGINCLIGPGDSGKSTVLDAIDLCLGARRNLQFDDSDFNGLNVDAAISISLTIGDLDDRLRNIDSYGLFVRGFHIQSGEISDEPEAGSETVLTLNLTVSSDLEPTWSLLSDRAHAQGISKNLAWADRVRLAPIRIGALADQHLGWRRGSVLNRLTTEGPDASATLLKAAREARTAFGNEASNELVETLALVYKTAMSLGVPINGAAKALLDAESVSFSGGTISLHDGVGVPLRGLGMGSARLLIAGLQRAAAETASIVLLDELEHGLEPHRIHRLLTSLGAKDAEAPLQAFVTTHSPAALRELSGRQLFVTRAREGRHELLNVGHEDDIQSTIRLFPDAFLAPSVIVCEGASEVGFIRGLDRRRVEMDLAGIGALGVALVDSGGIGNTFRRASVFQQLGYRVAVLRDDDDRPSAKVEQAFQDQGGIVFAWREGRALEDEIFLSLPDDAILGLIKQAVELRGEHVIAGHVAARSTIGRDLNSIQMESLFDGISVEGRQILARAATIPKAGWFKSVSKMEAAAYEHVSANLQGAETAFVVVVEGIFTWCSSGQR